VNNKKAPNLYGMRLLAYFVTPKVEKSNFYNDLNTLIDSEFTTKKILEKKK
jgi:hypothetical protein